MIRFYNTGGSDVLRIDEILELASLKGDQHEDARYAKLAVNLMLAVSAGMLGEALALARCGHVAIGDVLDVIAAPAGGQLAYFGLEWPPASGSNISCHIITEASEFTKRRGYQRTRTLDY